MKASNFFKKKKKYKLKNINEFLLIITTAENHSFSKPYNIFLRNI